MRTRRSVKSFCGKKIPIEVISNCTRISASAPSGANTQPWSFVLVGDPEMKKAIREKTEEVEKAFYSKESTEAWRTKLKPLRTNAEKPFLEEAPYLVCIFVRRYSFDKQGNGGYRH